MNTIILISEKTNLNDKAEKEAARAGLLREGLHLMGCGARADRFSARDLVPAPDGKPAFRDLPGLHFSLSHSGSLIACAFSGREIGLDLQETTDRADPLRIARRFYTPAEYDLLRALPEARRPDLFYRLWAVKEAYLKYIGCGLRARLDSFDMDPFPDRDCPPLALSPSGLTVRPVDTLPSFSGRILVRGEENLLRPASYTLLSAPAGYTMAVCDRGTGTVSH